uniref:Uncharacterized protein n=1 Tax=Siphoviridae sp. cttFh17 TaxID=2826491 RepID=A0A8S5NHZ4_9CAUD|nr:MAG TPA: hypothetical protein [Siphoviridae sp. cttFh17]
MLRNHILRYDHLHNRKLDTAYLYILSFISLLSVKFFARNESFMLSV